MAIEYILRKENNHTEMSTRETGLVEMSGDSLEQRSRVGAIGISHMVGAITDPRGLLHRGPQQPFPLRTL